MINVLLCSRATISTRSPVNRSSRECRLRLNEGCTELVVNFSHTEIVNSIGVSILLGVIDSAKGTGAKVVFSEVKQETVELFDMLGLTRHVQLV